MAKNILDVGRLVLTLLEIQPIDIDVIINRYFIDRGFNPS